MTLKINGVDLFALENKAKIAFDGLEFDLNDLDGEDSGRVENGLLYRVKIAEIHTITIKFIPMKPADLSLLLSECRKKFVTIEFSDPFDSLRTVSAEFYNSSRNVKIKSISEGGIKYYDAVTLKFIGRGIPLGGGDSW